MLEILIDTATKVSISQDFLKAYPDEDTAFGSIEVEIDAYYVIGHFAPDLKTLPLIEAFNKII